MYGGFFYKSLTINSAGTFFSGRLSGGDRCMEVTVNRGSTVAASVETKTGKTTFLDNFRSSRPEVL